MLKQFKTFAYIIFIVFIIVFAFNFYLLWWLNVDKISIPIVAQIDDEPSVDTEKSIEAELRDGVKLLRRVYFGANPSYNAFKMGILAAFERTDCANYSNYWTTAKKMIRDNQIYPIDLTGKNRIIGKLRCSLQSATIKLARNWPKGTQLKLLLELDDRQKVVFKPKWYRRDKIIQGSVYAGKDRHHAEIVAFYLSALLNLPWTPIAVGRRLHLKNDVYNVSDADLRATIRFEGSPSNRSEEKYCLYGNCHYCNPSESVCSDRQGLIEGVILLEINGPLKKHRSPWQRTYKTDVPAIWQKDQNYCLTIRDQITQQRLLDLIDASILDFLMQNGDRHHYETRQDRLVLLDNGKGLGNPKIDFLDVLAPFYQCCLIRKSTWNRLLLFTGGQRLASLLDELTKNDLLYPVFTEPHQAAIERRLLFVYSALEYCFKKYGQWTVLYE